MDVTDNPEGNIYRSFVLSIHVGFTVAAAAPRIPGPRPCCAPPARWAASAGRSDPTASARLLGPAASTMEVEWDRMGPPSDVCWFINHDNPH